MKIENCRKMKNEKHQQPTNLNKKKNEKWKIKNDKNLNCLIFNSFLKLVTSVSFDSIFCSNQQQNEFTLKTHWFKL